VENRGAASTTHRVDSGAIVLFVCATSTTHLVSYQSVLSFRPSFLRLSPSTTSDTEPSALLLSPQTLLDPELTLSTTSVPLLLSCAKIARPSIDCLEKLLLEDLTRPARIEAQDSGFLFESQTRRNSQTNVKHEAHNPSGRHRLGLSVLLRPARVCNHRAQART
jgi:hypothetical protein